MDLGGNYLRTFWHVTLPNIRMALLAAALLAITLSLDEVVITYFRSAPKNAADGDLDADPVRLHP